MANQEQLAILKQGVEVWNKWRLGYPDVEVDLSGADLNKADLGTDLAGEKPVLEAWMELNG